MLDGIITEESFKIIIILALILILTWRVKKKNSLKDESVRVPWNSFDVLKIMGMILIYYGGRHIYSIYNEFIQAGVILKTPLSITFILEPLLFDVVIIFSLTYFVVLKYHLRIKNLGFTTNRIRQNVNLAFRIGIVAGILNLGHLYLDVGSYIYYYPLFPLWMEEVYSRPFLLGLWTLQVILLGPFVEEFLFRGCAYPAFKKNFGKWWAMFLSTFFWAIIHPTNLFVGLMFWGLIWVYLYEKTKSLIPCLVIHSLRNATVFSLFFYSYFYDEGIITLSPKALFLFATPLLVIIFITLQVLSQKSDNVGILYVKN